LKHGKQLKKLLKLGKLEVVGLVIMEFIIYKNFLTRNPRLSLLLIKLNYILSYKGMILTLFVRSMESILKVWSNFLVRLMIAYSPLTRGQRLNDPALVPLAKKYSKSVAQILIRYSLQKVQCLLI
jgi:hypothetical protein